jgi:hypothetical protein
MRQPTQLPTASKVKAFFPLHRKCVIKVMLLLIQCIFRCRTVNLNKCKAEAGAVLGRKDLKLHNIYTRFIRFFKIKGIDAFCVGLTWLIIYLIGFESTVYMVMDRTNWKIGKININVLFIGLLLPNGVFIPIIWENLDKRGNSSQKERIDIMERFCKVWQSHTDFKITLLADREFIGIEWFSFIRKLQWSFVIRLRYQDYLGKVAIKLDKTIDKTERLIERKIKRNGFFQAEIELNNEKLFFTVFHNTGKRKEKGDKYVILLSDFEDVQLIKESYRQRWGIEVYFYHCKSNGFNLEDLNLINLLKAQLMMGVTAVAYVLCILNGLKCQRTKKVKVYLKDYKGKKVRAISLFRLGYDELKSVIHTLQELIQIILKWLKPIPKDFKSNAKIILKSV